MKTFYVSLVRDLLYCYLEFQADSEETVRQYLAEYYFDNNTWKLPWCAVYEQIPGCDVDRAIIIKAQVGPLMKGSF